MKRRHVVVLVSAITLLTLVFMMAVTIGIGVGTDPGREQIRSLIEQQVGSRIKGKLHLGKVSGGLLTGFTIDTFAIRDTEDSLLVSFGQMTVEYDPRDLLDRRILLRNLRVERPFVRLRQYEEGDWNYQRVFASDKPSGPTVPGRKFGDYVVLEGVDLRGGTFLLTRPWAPDDSLRGARRDSAIQRNLANPEREIRRNTDGLTHTYRWSNITGELPRVRIADPDSARFGQQFNIASMRVDELEPPFNFRNIRGVVRRLDDSVFVDIDHFDLPASTGSGRGKIWWGGGLPVRVDVRVRGDSVSLRDVAWVYPTLPRVGGGSVDLRIRNNLDDLNDFEYQLTNMDVRADRSRLTGAMTFVAGGPVLKVTNVDLRAAPVNFDLLRTLAGEPLPVDWQGDLTGYVRGPGGPLTNFIVTESDVTFRDAHVAGAVSRATGRGGLNILEPALTEFRDFTVNVATLDLRSIQYLYPSFPRLGGFVSGVATLDSSWLDVRFSDADVTHTNGPGDPTRVTGSGRVTYGEEFMTYDLAVNAEPLSLTMLSRAYPLGLEGLLSGPITARGTTNDLALVADLQGPAGRISFNGRVDAFPLSVAARGAGRIDALDPRLLVANAEAPPASLSGTYQIDVRADTNDIGTLAGSASMLLERSEVDGVRLFPSRARVRFAQGRMFVDTLRIESVAALVTASGALGLTGRASDSLTYQVVVDSLGGLRPYIARFASGLAAPDGTVGDSLSGSFTISGTARGSLESLSVAGRVTGTNLYVRREVGREIGATYEIANVLRAPSGAASIRVAGIDVGGIRLDTVVTRVTLDREQRGNFTFGAWAPNGVTLNARGDVNRVEDWTQLLLQEMELATDSSRWSLARATSAEQRGNSVAIDSLELINGRGGRVMFAAAVPDSGAARMLLRADSLSLRDLGRILQVRKPLSGWATIAADGAGTSANPVMNLRSQLRAVRFGSVELDRVDANAEYANRRALVSVDVATGRRPTLLARGSLPIEMRYFGARLLEDSLRGTIRTDSASFSLVEALVPGLRDATGALAVTVDVGGTWDHPDLTGSLRVTDGEVTVDTLGIRVRGVNVDVALFGHRDSLAIRRVAGWSGETTADSIALSGYVAYRNFDNPLLDLRLHARRFHVLDRRALARLDVSTEPGGLTLRGRLRGAVLEGGMIVDRGSIYLPDPELLRKQIADVSDLRDTVDTRFLPTPPSRLLESIRVENVSITLGDEVRLQSREADIKLAGSLNVTRTSRQRRGTILGIGTPTGADSLSLALDGVLIAERGTYTLSLPAVRREFQVEGGTITFFGTSELAPELNISAIHTVRTSQGSDLRIRVRLSGPLLPNPIVTLESAESFALSQSDMVSYLIFGQPNFELGSEGRSLVQVAAQTLLPTAQSWAASELRTVLGPLADIVTLRPGSADAGALLSPGQTTAALQDALLSSRIAAERQLTDNLFVSISTPICQFRAVGQQSDFEVLEVVNGLSGRIEYRLSNESSIRAGKEPSALVCGRPTTGRVVPTPSQWGLSFFKTWRF